MNILSIDIGSYSVKFLEIHLDRRKPKITRTHEVIIDKVRPQFDAAISLQEIQQKIIKNYIGDHGYEGKLISQFPSDFSTTRYFTLPVSKKNKAELMLPFQLDENLPFPLNNVHHASYFRKMGAEYKVISDIAEKEVFDSYYQYLIDQHTLPSLLTSELLAIQSYVEMKEMNGHFAILDIGHQTSRLYTSNGPEIVADHTSHIGGKIINEVIGQTYKIGVEDAIEYKHKNCFFLTSGQYSSVDDDQREFALLMKQTFWPLLQDIKRWFLGHRVKHGRNIEKIYLIGGTAQIKNISGFLAEHLGVSVERFPLKTLQNQVGKPESLPFAMSYFMAIGQKSKSPPANFLNHDYAAAFASGISLHSSAFVFSRVLFVCLLLGIGLLVERFAVQNSQYEELRGKVSKVIKNNPSLNLTKAQQSSLLRDPEKLSEKLNSLSKDFQKDYDELKEIYGQSALNSLAQLTSVVERNELINLVRFVGDISSGQAKFKSEEPQEMEKFKNFLQSSSLGTGKISYKTGATELTLDFQVNP